MVGYGRGSALALAVPPPGPTTVMSPTCVSTNVAYAPARQAEEVEPTASADQLIRQFSLGLICGGTNAAPNPMPFCGARLPTAT